MKKNRQSTILPTLLPTLQIYKPRLIHFWDTNIIYACRIVNIIKYKVYFPYLLNVFQNKNIKSKRHNIEYIQLFFK